MGFFSAEMEPLIETYQREAVTLLKKYTDCLALISQDKLFSQERVDAVFRVVHTLKSSSAMMGLNDFSACAHSLEDLIQIFRSNPSLTAGNELPIVDLLYAVGDYMESETNAITSENFRPSATDKYVGLIREAMKKYAKSVEETDRNAEQTASVDSSVSAETVKDGTGSFLVFFVEDCSMENVRAFQLIKQLQPYCSGIHSIPEKLDENTAAAYIRKNGLTVSVEAGDNEKIRQVCNASPYVREVQSFDVGKKGNSSADAAHTTEKENKYGMVAWEKLLAIQTLVGELITSHTGMNIALENTAFYRDVEGELLQNRKLLDQLERMVSSVSMMPVSSVTSQYYRMIRDIAVKENKKVQFDLIGEELELDRKLLDAMSAPLLHLIRNAVDHGIESPEIRRQLGKPETGTVKLAIECIGGNVRFTVSDDGGGMNPKEILQKAKEKGLLKKEESKYTKPEILSFIFAPGFTTTKLVNEYSGRGVGMDVVRKTADSLRGVVRVDSDYQRGSVISIEVPVTMFSFGCIHFNVGKYSCMLPIRNMEKLMAFQDAEDQCRYIDGKLWLEDEKLLPVIDMFDLLGEPRSPKLRLLFIRGIDHQAVLLTGEVNGERTTVEKPLPALISNYLAVKYGICGCAAVGAGNLSYIFNTEQLLKKCAEGELESNG